MRLGEMLRAMFRAFFIIATGATISMYIFCLIFKPDVSFSLADIRGILMVAFVSDLTFVVFYSRKELSKKQMLIRFIIHVPVVLAVLLYSAHLLNWGNMDSPKEVTVFILLVLGVYAMVLAVSAYQDKKTADKLNDGLNRRYHS